MKKFNLLILLSVFLYAGCSEKDMLTDEPEIAENGSQLPETVQVKDGVLVFRDYLSFENSLELFSSMSIAQYQNWIEENNVQTLLGAFNEVCIANDTFDNLVLNGSILPEPGKNFSDTYYHYLEKGLIAETKDRETNEIDFDLVTPAPYWASVLNHDGVFAVGDSLFHVAENFIRILPLSNINRLKSCSDVDNLKLDEGSVWVLQSQGEECQLKSFPGNNNTLSSGYSYSSGNGRRTRINVKFQSWQHLGNGTEWQYIHYWEIKNQRKRGILGWRDGAYKSTVFGEWSGRLYFYAPGTMNTVHEFLNSSCQSNTFTAYRAWSNVSIVDGTGNAANGENPWTISISINNQRQTIVGVNIEHAKWKVVAEFATAKIEYGNYQWD